MSEYGAEKNKNKVLLNNLSNCGLDICLFCKILPIFFISINELNENI